MMDAKAIEAMQYAQGALIMLIEPAAIKQSSSGAAFATCVEAERKLRAALIALGALQHWENPQPRSPTGEPHHD
jgi:hypothetical protein